MNMSIVGAMNLAIDFRLFLRNCFYPKNQQLIQDSLYSYIEGIDDIDYISDSFSYRLKCKTKKTTVQDMDGSNIETAIVTMLQKGNVLQEISSANAISDNKRVDFMSVYTQILQQIHFCGYLKTLYNMAWFPYTSTTFMMELCL